MADAHSTLSDQNDGRAWGSRAPRGKVRTLAGVRVRQLHEDDPERLGSYRLLWRLSTGGMGRVYLARRTADSPLVAVKTLLEEGVVSAADRQRFAREVDLARRVDSAYTARVLDADADTERPWMALEYVPAPSLADLVADAGQLPNWAVPWVAAGTVQALLALHDKGVIHRDVKPQNILMPLTGPLLIDFGVSHAVDLTRTSVTLGTIAFTSPEQAQGEASTRASDVFSLGATLFHLAVGRPPYPQTDTPMQLLALVQRGRVDLSGLPGALAPLIRPCLALEPGDRPDPADLLVRTLAETERTARRRGERWLPVRWTALIEAHEAHGRALAATGESATADSATRTRPTPPPSPTLVDPGEREARRQREREARRLRERREEELRGLREEARRQREREARREREREAAQRARNSAGDRPGSGGGSRPGSGSGGQPPSPRGTRSSASGVVATLAVVLVLVLLIWQGGDDDGDDSGAQATSTGTPSRTVEAGSGITDTDRDTGPDRHPGRDLTGGLDDDGGRDEETRRPEPKTPSPTPDPTEKAFRAVSSGDCLLVYDTGRGGGTTVDWSAKVPPNPVSCASEKAYVQVTSVSGDCPITIGKSSWTYRSPVSGRTTKLCLTRIYHPSYCLLGKQSGDRISLGSMTAVDCARKPVPVPYNQIMHITGVYQAPPGANASNCRRAQGDQTRYWAWLVDDGDTLLCTTIYRGN